MLNSGRRFQYSDLNYDVRQLLFEFRVVIRGLKIDLLLKDEVIIFEILSEPNSLTDWHSDQHNSDSKALLFNFVLLSKFHL